MSYVTALSYRTAELVGSPYIKNNKPYTIIKQKCDRCVNGIYAVGVENGRIKPHPAYNGVCLKCNGVGYTKKEVRLYEEEEYNRIRERAEKQKERKEQERKEEQAKNFETNKANWLKSNGFSAEGWTYIYFEESYSIKEQLKEAGFRFDLVRLWHRDRPDGYEDKVISVFVDDIIEFAANGNGYYKTEAKAFINKKIAEVQGCDASGWVGAVGNTINIPSATFIKKGGFYGAYGWTNIYTFKDRDDNMYTWFSTVNLNFDIDEVVNIKGKVKNRDEYNGIKTTILTRCKVTKVD